MYIIKVHKEYYMDYKKVVQEAFGNVVKGQEFNDDTEIKALGIDSLDLV